MVQVTLTERLVDPESRVALGKRGEVIEVDEETASALIADGLAEPASTEESQGEPASTEEPQGEPASTEEPQGEPTSGVPDTSQE